GCLFGIAMDTVDPGCVKRLPWGKGTRVSLSHSRLTKTQLSVCPARHTTVLIQYYCSELVCCCGGTDRRTLIFPRQAMGGGVIGGHQMAHPTPLELFWVCL